MASCKKCKKEIPDGALYCQWCGAPQKRSPKKKMYQRPDGLFEQSKVIDGKRVVFRGKTEKEVTDKMVAYTAQQEAGPAFREIAEDWREEAYREIEYNTAKGYEAKYKHALEYFEGRRIKEIEPADVRAYVKYLSARGYAYKTVAHHLSVLRLILDYAVEKGIIQLNPATGVTIPKRLPRSHREMPSDADLHLIRDNAGNGLQGLLGAFVLYTGCRSGEAYAVQQKDIDRKARMLTIGKAVYYQHNRAKIKTPKTASGVRAVPLPQFLIDLIPEGNPNDYIFSETGAEPLPDSQRRRGWEKFQQETGIVCTLHQLRHAYASLLYEAGIDEKSAQKLMGHSDISTTMNIYTHLREQHLAISQEVFRDFLNAK